MYITRYDTISIYDTIYISIYHYIYITTYSDIDIHIVIYRYSVI